VPLEAAPCRAGWCRRRWGHRSRRRARVSSASRVPIPQWVDTVPQAGDEVEAVGINGRVDLLEQVNAHSGGQRDTLACVGDLHLVEAAALGRGSEWSWPRRGNNGNSKLVLSVRIGPIRRRGSKVALWIRYANDGASGVEVTAIRADRRIVTEDRAEAKPLCRGN
jgi:hypothetical protein